jgi:hypothetical protein
MTPTARKRSLTTNDFDDNSRKVNLSSRYYIGHVDLLKAAAAKVGVTVASLQRRATILEAARVLDVDPPEFASLEVDRDVVAEAASREGLTKQEYAMRAAEREARRVLAKPRGR